jgi:hypothetical protein
MAWVLCCGGVVIPVEAFILLADAATVNISGNLDALGVGWDITGPSPLPGFTIVILIKAPLDWPEEHIGSMKVSLFDASGEPVKVPGSPSGEISFEVQLQFPPASTRPAGLRGGVAGITTVAPGLMLAPGIYEWVASIDGEEDVTWRRPFYVRAAPDEFAAQIRLMPSDNLG